MWCIKAHMKTRSPPPLFFTLPLRNRRCILPLFCVWCIPNTSRGQPAVTLTTLSASLIKSYGPIKTSSSSLLLGPCPALCFAFLFHSRSLSPTGLHLHLVGNCCPSPAFSAITENRPPILLPFHPQTIHSRYYHTSCTILDHRSSCSLDSHISSWRTRRSNPSWRISTKATNMVILSDRAHAPSRSV